MPLVATVFHKMGGKGFSLGGGAPLRYVPALWCPTSIVTTLFSKLSAPPPPPHHSKLFLHQNTFLLHTTSEPINSKITNADQSIFLTPLPPIMDFIKQATGQGDNKEQKEGENKEQGGGGFLGGIGDKINSAAGGGKESEKNEDYLDKGQSVPITRFMPILTAIDQVSMPSNSTFSGRVTRAMNQLSSRQKMKRSVTSSETNTNLAVARNSQLMTRRPSWVDGEPLTQPAFVACPELKDAPGLK